MIGGGGGNRLRERGRMSGNGKGKGTWCTSLQCGSQWMHETRRGPYIGWAHGGEDKKNTSRRRRWREENACSLNGLVEAIEAY